MEVKPGYKETEAGVFPADWEIEPLGRHATFRTGPFGSALHKSDYIDGGIPVVNPMHIVDGTIEPTRTMTIAEHAAKDLPDFRMNAGEIVIGRRGDMGRCAVVEEHQAGWLCGTGSMIVRPRNVDAAFLQRVLSSPRAISAIEHASVGTTMVSLNEGTLAGLKVQLPPLPEQRAIATALSDVDALLEGLDRIIAKKRNLKQAAMQQLLTGQTRLPGFHGEWKSKKFSDLLTYERPDKYLVNGTDYEQGGDTPVLTANKSFILGYTNEKFGVCQSPPVIIFDDFTTDSKYVDFPFKVKSSAIKILRSRSSDVNLRLVAERMRLVRFPVGEHKRYYISEYRHLELPTPDSEEQCAIEAALSDMDAELAALEARRDKTRDLQQAVTQELLTGKTRLVPTGAARA